MMNIQPGGQGRRKVVRRNNGADENKGSEAFFHLLASVGQAALFILVIGAFFHMYIKLDQEINVIEDEICRINEDISSLDRDIEGLKGRYARCSSRQFICQQIARFNLPLEQIRYDQQEVIRVYSNEQLARLRYPVVRRREVAQNGRRSVRGGH